MSKIDPTHKPALQRILADQRSPLRQLIVQTQHLSNLQNKVMSCLPAELHPHVIVVGVRDQSLLLHTDSGVWATRLRQLGEDILKRVRESAPELAVRSLTIKVRPRAHTRKLKRQANRLSEENARLLMEEAEQTKDEGLQRVLRSIARHTKKDSGQD